MKTITMLLLGSSLLVSGALVACSQRPAETIGSAAYAPDALYARLREASPAPFAASIVSNMSATSARSSRVSKRSTGCAMRSSRGSPIFRISRTAIVCSFRVRTPC